VGRWRVGRSALQRRRGKSCRIVRLTIDQLHRSSSGSRRPSRQGRNGEKVYEDVGLTDIYCLPNGKNCWIIGEFGYIFHSDNAADLERAAIQQDISVPPIRLGYNEIEITRSTPSRCESSPRRSSICAPERRDRTGGERRGACGICKEDDPTPLFEILEARQQAISAVLEEAGLLSDRIRKRGSPPWDYEDFLDSDPSSCAAISRRKADEPGIAVTIAQNPYLFSVRFADPNEVTSRVSAASCSCPRRRT